MVWDITPFTLNLSKCTARCATKTEHYETQHRCTAAPPSLVTHEDSKTVKFRNV